MITDKAIKWNGKQITKPGIYAGIGIDVYHGQSILDGPSVSSSGLRTVFNESPAHFYMNWSGNPDRKQDGDTKRHFILGRAVHHLMLGEPFFAKLFAIQPDEYTDPATGETKKWHNGAKVCKTWQAEQKEAGREVLTGADVDAIRGMAKSLGNYALVSHAGMLNGAIERSMFYRDKDTGLWVKVRPDAIPNDSGDYADLKTTTSVLWEDIRRTIYDLGYHQQLALLRTACRELGLPFTSASLLFIEKQEPFCIRTVTIKDRDLDLGERANRAALDAVAECMKRKRWPGPGGWREDVENIEMPEWAQNKIEDRIKYGIAT